MTMSINRRRYSELKLLDTFEERFDYLLIGGSVGEHTFGFDRYINQGFYTSKEWRDIRNEVIVRDSGCDLGIPGYEINGALVIHHINPMSADDITHGEEWILDPEFLITTTKSTHNAIHYGNRTQLAQPFVERAPGDTKLW
jgi:hypothetical protein